MLPLAILSLLTLAAAATRLVPTAEEMQARFEHGQNFYASGPMIRPLKTTATSCAVGTSCSRWRPFEFPSAK